MWTLREGNCAEVLKTLEEGSIDLTVTSPPYDNLRDYKGYTFDFPAIAQELYRVTKDGGVVVWVVGDIARNFCETLSSFKQAIYFVEKCGFNLLDTMIYAKTGRPPTFNNIKRYGDAFEYMFVLVRGKPVVFNPIKDVPNKYAGTKSTGNTARQGGDDLCELREYIVPQFSQRFNVWTYNTGFNHSTKDRIAFNHPAIFPEQLARDHIYSWTNPGDTVLDPFAGSGTTLKMAQSLKRRSIGIEISPEYCDIIRKRMSGLQVPLFA